MLAAASVRFLKEKENLYIDVQGLVVNIFKLLCDSYLQVKFIQNDMIQFNIKKGLVYDREFL